MFQHMFLLLRMKQMCAPELQLEVKGGLDSQEVPYR